MLRFFAVGLLGFSLAFICVAQVPPRLELYFQPSHPVAGEPIYLVYRVSDTPACTANVDYVKGAVVQSGAGFRLEVPMAAERQGCFDGVHLTYELGRFPAGRYTVEAELVDPQGGAEYPEVADGATRVSATVEVQPTPLVQERPHADYSGMWWNPDVSGSAAYVFQQPDRKLIVLFATFSSPDREPEWYFLGGGEWVGYSVFRGPLLRARGGPTLDDWHYGLIGRPALSLDVESVGEAELAFGGANPKESSLRVVIRRPGREDLVSDFWWFAY